MKVLVTGGAGFIGSHLVETLLGRGDSVVVIDNFNDYYDPALKRENLEGVTDNPVFTLHKIDIRDAGAVASVVDSERPDVVCHLAARAGVRPSIVDPILYEQTNCLGTMNILEAVKAKGVKNFVFASSSSVYGENSKSPFSEDDPVDHPISPYAATKRAGELMLYTYAHLYGLPVTCLRFFTVYGERGRPDMAVARFTKFIDEGSPLPVYGDGTARRDFTYIGDIVKGVVSAIDRPCGYEIINIGGSGVIEVNRLIEVIEDRLGKKAVIDYTEPFAGDVPLTCADTGKEERLLGFVPAVDIVEGIDRYVTWYQGRKKG
ncbi:dTDP-glucose 4,6-dehydratase [hydrothermal vent metagenome]|uniref:dTDP-glucose 4,6-dehydratase n=1 Tax=hydrothermal vent metagenome TaxID=652676 RepID=A0A3B0QRX1_9ZZZZ